MANHNFIYRITCKQNGKIYIGQTESLKSRWYKHQQFAKKSPTQVIHLAMRKYGIDNFTFEHIATCLNQEATDIVESELIAYYKSNKSKFGYNILPGGQPKPSKLPSVREKISLSLKKYYTSIDPNFRRKICEPKLTPEKEDLLCLMYNLGGHSGWLSRYFGISRNTVARILKRNGHVVRSKGCNDGWRKPLE